MAPFNSPIGPDSLPGVKWEKSSWKSSAPNAAVKALYRQRIDRRMLVESRYSPSKYLVSLTNCHYLALRLQHPAGWYVDCLSMKPLTKSDQLCGERPCLHSNA